MFAPPRARLCDGCQRRSVVHPSVIRSVVISRKLSKTDPTVAMEYCIISLEGGIADSIAA